MEVSKFWALRKGFGNDIAELHDHRSMDKIEKGPEMS